MISKLKFYNGGGRRNAQKVTFNGIEFDSKREMNRYYDLMLLERAGQIQALRTHVAFELSPSYYADGEIIKKGIHKGERKRGKLIQRACVYIADFVYFENGKEIVEDCKGFREEDYKIKKKWLYDKYRIIIKET